MSGGSWIMREKILEFIISITELTYDNNEQILNMLADNLEMDSMDKLSLIIMIEEEYNICLDNEIMCLNYNNTVGDLIDSAIMLIDNIKK